MDHSRETPSSLSSRNAQVDTASTEAWKVFLLVAAALFAVYLPTARKTLPYHIDALTNVYTAWTIGTTGSPILQSHSPLLDYYGQFAWVVTSARGPVSQYPPGAALLTAPFYASFWQESRVETLGADLAGEGITVTVPVPNLFPAAIVASLTTALAVALAAMSVMRATGRRTDALLVGVLLGVGTGAWTVASDSLWQHGPDMMFVALGMYLGSRQRWLGAGLAFGALALTRPPVLVVGAAVGAMLLVRRDWRSAMRMLVGSLPGIVALLTYNWWLFGRLTVSGGYGDAFTNRALEGDLGWYLANIADAFVSPQIGLFIWSPFLAMLVFGVGRAWREAPDWARYAAIGGVILLLIQLKANRASGGAGFWYYRYPLESLVAIAPLFPAAWNHLWTLGALGRRALFASTAYAVVVHSLVALR